MDHDDLPRFYAPRTSCMQKDHQREEQHQPQCPHRSVGYISDSKIMSLNIRIPDRAPKRSSFIRMVPLASKEGL
jgi:hypothetical protein